MTLDSLNIAAGWPEIFLLAMACVVLVVDVFISQKNRNITYLLSQLTLVVTFALIYTNQTDVRVLAFNDMFVQDKMSDVLKLFIVLIVFCCFRVFAGLPKR